MLLDVFLIGYGRQKCTSNTDILVVQFARNCANSIRVMKNFSITRLHPFPLLEM